MRDLKHELLNVTRDTQSLKLVTAPRI